MPKFKELIQPPPEPEGNEEQQIAALRDYLVKITQELYYILTHLEADNINDSTFKKISEMIPRPYVGQPVPDGDPSSVQSSQWARGDHRHGNDSTKADVTALEAAREALEDALELEADAREAHEDDTGNPHEVTAAQVGLGNVANERQYSAQNPPPIPTPVQVGAIPVTEKGSAGGVAELDSNGMVPSAQLPSYVDDVLNYPTLADFPAIGEDGKIYVAKDTNRQYRWSGSDYVEINKSLALGETSSTAYRGDRGKAAYDHSQTTSGNPHNVTAAEVGLGNVANERQYSALNPPPLPTPADIGAATAQDLTDHVGDTNNPHGVTAAQAGARPDTWTPSKSDIGLGNVENERQYSAQNPPPYPVTSVNGSTGAVVLDASDVGARADDWVPSASDVGVIPNPAGSPTTTLAKLEIDSTVYEITGGGGGGPDPATQTPVMDGTGAVGISLKYAREDHEHPADTGKQDAITASGILLGDGAGGVSAATAGTDYQTPLTAGTDYATPGQLATKAPFSAGIFPGTSSTAGGTQAKVGTVPDLTGLTALYDGLCICMTFANAQTYDGQPTLDIGIPYAGVTTFGINRTSASAAGIYDWGTGSAVDLVFDATNAVWVMKKGQHGSAVRYGVLLLSDSVSENSTVGGGKAATPAAVKAAYDLAFDANTRPVLPYWLDYGTISSLPQTIPEEVLAGDTVDYFELGNPGAMGSPWTVTTADGSLTISGTCLGTTSLRLHMTHNQ